MLNTIYIPTMGRSDIQITYDKLPYKYKKKVVFVIPKDEWSLMTKKYGDDQLLTTPTEIKGIAATREFICRHAGKTRFSMIDDDVVFYRRNQKYYSDFDKKSNMDKSKRIATESDLDDMFALFDKWMDDDVIHIGHRRANLPPAKKSYDNIAFFNSIHHINGELLSEIIDEINWTRCEVGEDANFMFEYLTRGYKNRKSCEFSAHWDSFQEGGCAIYRDSKLHNQEHKKLQDHWGKDFVRVRKEMIGQGTHGHNIGMIKEFSYKPKLIRKLWEQQNGMEEDLNVLQPKKQFQPELDKRVKT